MTLHEDEFPTEQPKVGYKRPPVHTRFRKGQSGNPRGRTRGSTEERLKLLAIEEAYRKVKVREGESVIEVPALQAIFRSQVTNAAKGSGPAERAIIDLVAAIEHEFELRAAAKAERSAKDKRVSDIELARRIAFILGNAERSANKEAGS